DRGPRDAEGGHAPQLVERPAAFREAAPLVEADAKLAPREDERIAGAALVDPGLRRTRAFAHRLRVVEAGAHLAPVHLGRLAEEREHLPAARLGARGPRSREAVVGRLPGAADRVLTLVLRCRRRGIAPGPEEPLELLALLGVAQPAELLLLARHEEEPHPLQPALEVLVELLAGGGGERDQGE